MRWRRGMNSGRLGSGAWLKALLVVGACCTGDARATEPPPAPPAAASLSRAEHARLERGEVLLRTDVRRVGGKAEGFSLALGVINATPDQCWAEVLAYDNFLSTIPRLKQFKIHQRDADHALVWEQYGVMFRRFSFTLKIAFDHRARHVSWVMDKTRESDVDDVQGGITYLPYDGGRTLMVYEAYLDTGTWTPEFLQDLVTRRDLPELVNNVRRQAEARAARERKMAPAPSSQAPSPLVAFPDAGSTPDGGG